MAGIITGTAASAYSAETARSVALSHQTYSYQEGRARVTEHHYELPKGQSGNLAGSYSYRTVSAKAGQLKARIAGENRRLRAQILSDRRSGAVNHAKRARIKCRMKYLQDQLNNEIAASPVTKVVVHEKDDRKGAGSSMEAQTYELLLSSCGDAADPGIEICGIPDGE